MDWTFLWQGAVIGFCIAAPVGPIGLLTIRRTLADGWGMGFVTGMGAATADAAYGVVAAFGLTAISAALLSAQTPLQLVGGAFLCWLGVRIFVAKPASDTSTAAARGKLAAYLSTVLLTLANPATILSFLAVFAGLGLASTSAGPAEASAIVFGVFLGSAAWWLLLSTSITLMRHGVTARAMSWINRASGLLLAGFGVWAVAAALR